MSRDNFDCHDLEVGVVMALLLASSGWKLGMLLNQCTEQQESFLLRSYEVKKKQNPHLFVHPYIYPSMYLFSKLIYEVNIELIMY